MYLIIKILAVLFCIVGVIYLIRLNTRYKNDHSSSKEEIIKYFKEHQAINLNNGITTKDLPKSISSNPYLLMMVKDKTLVFEKGKYYLNLNE